MNKQSQQKTKWKEKGGLEEPKILIKLKQKTILDPARSVVVQIEMSWSKS